MSTFTVGLFITVKEIDQPIGTVSSGIKVSIASNSEDTQWVLLTGDALVATFKGVVPGEYAYTVATVSDTGEQIGEAISGKFTVIEEFVKILVPDFVSVSVTRE